MRAEPRQNNIEIDGVLDEADWSRAQVGRDFIERLPTPGAAPPVQTEVRLLFDRTAVYVGITCHMMPGEQPRILELTRDSFRIWNDDAITLKFDVRHDRRTTVGFGLNAGAAQIDFIALDNGRVFRRQYDAVWEAETSIEEDRWHAEFRIPAAALGLPSTDGERIIGFNVSRDHNLRQATYDWSHLRPEFGPAWALEYGTVSGLQGIGGGMPLVLNPYVLVNWPGRDAWNLPFEWKAGGEFRLRLGNDIWGEITILTDFAEVDLDAQVVNLDRFPLFFPERRPFFLSGLDVFAFGDPGEAQLFFTRRIGLSDDAAPLPILGGLKAYGREGNFDFGVLGITTASTADAASSAFAITRLRYNLERGSYVGAIVGTRSFLPNNWGGVDDFDAEPHVSLGVDGMIRLAEQRLQLSGFAAFTRREGDEEERGDGMAGRAAIRWRGEEWNPSASLLYIQEGFNPELGFIRRPAIFQTNTEIPWIWRNPVEALRNIRLAAAGRLEYSDDFNEILRLSTAGQAGLVTDNQWVIAIRGEYIQDVVRSEFELVPGLDIEPGAYEGGLVRLLVDSPDARNPEFEFQLTYNSAFFGGSSYNLTGGFSFAIERYFRFAVNASGSLLDFPNRDLIPTIAANGVFTITPNARLAIDLVTQFNNVNERFIGMARMRWRYLPGSDLFLVYRERVDLDGETPTHDRSITLKLSYRYDALL